jgi:hypothetical protein
MLQRRRVAADWRWLWKRVKINVQVLMQGEEAERNSAL